MFDAAPSLSPLPLTQTAEYARAMAAFGQMVETVPFADRGYGVMQSRYVPLLGWTGLVSRGPVWTAGSTVSALKDGLSRVGHRVLINAEPGQEHLLERAGLLQIMTPATVAELDLAAGPDAMRAAMHQKWRNRLRRAERSAVQVTSRAMIADSQNWIIKAEKAQRKARRYRGLPPEFALAYAQANPQMARLFEARHKGKVIAGMLFLLHGARATYFIGHSLPDGRVWNAHNLLLAKAAQTLSQSGVATLDLGLVDTVNAPGLARFKLGSGARAQRLGGTWLYQRTLSSLIMPSVRRG
ncbi:GNAT family N-acetyltransferase [Aliishimia ponticola]|uniref:GNAT family N-acetyltransferase n=1 Tax=Aliishimia ponticola TaxID=2499833 RepID=A0A4S4NFG9_9RHOB|nr:GNAT family N-acetyltransferase [Aliishimia ponticola]THH36871.1 GNAT family N-acetyltransferase [Aliishimia ponticola]